MVAAVREAVGSQCDLLNWYPRAVFVGGRKTFWQAIRGPMTPCGLKNPCRPKAMRRGVDLAGSFFGADCQWRAAGYAL